MWKSSRVVIASLGSNTTFIAEESAPFKVLKEILSNLSQLFLPNIRTIKKADKGGID